MQQLRYGTSVLPILQQIQLKGNSPQLKHESLKQFMTEEQLKAYQMLQTKNLKRERSQLSQFRFQKMKNLILNEMKEAIQEAENEPEASVLNGMESIIEQNENDVF